MRQFLLLMYNKFVIIIYNVQLFIFMLNITINAQDFNETTTEITIISCKHKTELIGADNATIEVTEAVQEEKIILECHYCNENDPHEPKIWHKIDKFNLTSREVKLDMHKDEDLNRISVSIEHSLIIKNSTLKDIGVYFCRGLENTENSKYFNYIVDFVNKTDKKPETGDLKQWERYFDDYVHPINQKFLKSTEEIFVQIREHLQIYLDIVYDWEPDFSPCEVCGRPKGKGIKKKSGYCRIIIKNLNVTKRNTTGFHSIQNINYFTHLTKISCRSLLFEELFPRVGELTKTLRDFTIELKCNGTCTPDAAGVNQGFKFGSSKGYKYRRTITLEEGSHITLVCPESDDIDSTVIWRRNGKVLPRGSPVIHTDEELNKIHIVVDAFSSLYLIHVREEESGNYTCQVNDIRMQQIRVFVYSKSKLLTAELARHMKYLFFILILSGTCYCSGVIAAFFRRDRFKGYEEVSQVTTTYV